MGDASIHHERDRRADAIAEALQYPTFEAYDKAMGDAHSRAIRASGQRFRGNYLRSVRAARMAFLRGDPGR